MMTPMRPIDPDECVEIANKLVSLLSEVELKPTPEAAIAIMHVGICMARDVGVPLDGLQKQLAHAYEHGSSVVERAPKGVLS